MAAKTMTVRQNAEAVFTFVLTEFRNEASPGKVVDITGYTFKLAVKEAPADGQDLLFAELAGTIVSATKGQFRLTLTAAHTNFEAGSYKGEIKIWSGAATLPPTDSLSVDYIIEPAISNP